MRRQEHELYSTGGVFPISEHKLTRRGGSEARRREVNASIEAYVVALADKATNKWTLASELLEGRSTPPMQLGGPTDSAGVVFKKHGLKFNWAEDGLEVCRASEQEIQDWKDEESENMEEAA